MISLSDRLVDVIGKKSAVALEGLGLITVEDLIHHYPRRYATRGELSDLASLNPEEAATVMAEVAAATELPGRGRGGSRLSVTLTDGTDTLDITFFHQGSWHKSRLKPGVRGLFSGKVSEYRGRRQLAHPEYVLIAAPGEEPDPDAAEAFARALIPVYSTTGSLPSWRIARAISFVLDQLNLDAINDGSDEHSGVRGEVADPVPAPVLHRNKMSSLGEAIYNIHRPQEMADVVRARRRLVFEEAFVLQVVLAIRRLELAAFAAKPRPEQPGGLREAIEAALPFELTEGQRQVSGQLTAEISAPHPMHRLLQGDVGSGKTVVALLAMAQVVDNGGQAALLAPTEVLAAQHARSLSGLLGDAADRLVLLTGSLNTEQRRQVLADITSGQASIVVGTHALLSEGVDFQDLGLVVVDEQHRFGVEQRAALAAKAPGDARPHVLVMTATPIPRTVAMTVFGDLDVATLQELPKGRSPIATHVVLPRENPTHLSRTWQRVHEEVANGHQVYIVCPRIGDGDEEVSESGPSESRPPLAVKDVTPMLADGPLAGLRIEQLHGRLGAEEKEDVMTRFANGARATKPIDVLVTTTVIEVGVDVPNATMIVILDADRFGVSQLHQLRGRVGRGKASGLCLLVTEANEGSVARERLAQVAATTDGFELAQIDLELRKEGDILGSSQSGRRSRLRLLEVIKDADLVSLARDEAVALVQQDPSLSSWPTLKRAVEQLTQEEQTEFLERT